MSKLSFPCGAVPENSCQGCGNRRYEVQFPDATGDICKLCGPCLGAMYTAWQAVRTCVLTESELRRRVPTDQES